MKLIEALVEYGEGEVKLIRSKLEKDVVVVFFVGGEEIGSFGAPSLERVEISKRDGWSSMVIPLSLLQVWLDWARELALEEKLKGVVVIGLGQEDIQEVSYKFGGDGSKILLKVETVDGDELLVLDKVIDGVLKKIKGSKWLNVFGSQTICCK